MVEFQPFGSKSPHDPEGTLEHERDMREEAERAHLAKSAPGTERRPSLGYAIVLLGGPLFAVSCFLPYNGFSLGPGARTVSLYQQVAHGLDGGWNPGGVVFLFGGVTAVVAVAGSGLPRRQRWTGLAWLLVGAVSAWSLTWTGFLIYTGTVGVDTSLEIGFWLQAASIGIAIIGAILVVAPRAGAHEPGRLRFGADAT